MKNKVLLSIFVISLLFISGFSEGAKYDDKSENYLDTNVYSNTEIEDLGEVPDSGIVNNDLNNNVGVYEPEIEILEDEEPRRDEVINECGVVINEEGEYTLEEDLDCSSEEFREQEIPAITINADNVVLDCEGYSITGPSYLGYNNEIHGVYAEEVRGISVNNCEIIGFNRGIAFNNIEESEIINNNLSENNYGIRLEYSDSNIIRDNILNENYNYGILLYLDSDSNIIRDNIMNKNEYNGISLYSWSDSNTITGNIVNDNYGGGISLGYNSASNNINNNMFCYNEFDIYRGGGEYNEFLDNQCDYDIECIPCPIRLDTVTINLNIGWNLISSYLIPNDLDIEVIFNELVEEGSLDRVKDGQGRFFSPEYDFNNIEVWNPQEGYQVKMNRADRLVIQGEEYISPRIELEEGWNTIAYPLTESYNMEYVIEEFLAPLVDEDVLDIIKNGRGDFFISRWDFNNIPEMRPGEGYMIRVSEDTVLDFSNHNSIIEDYGIKYYMETDKHTYRLRDYNNKREYVKMLFRVTNLRDEVVHFLFSQAQQYHFEVRDEDRNRLWHIPTGIDEGGSSITLEPGESIEFRTEDRNLDLKHWKLRYNRRPVESGRYEIIGFLPFDSYEIGDGDRIREHYSVPVSVFVNVVEE